MKSRVADRGFSLITALFALVVFSGLAAAMVALFGVQTQSTNLALLESRVYAAAQAGADYGAYRAVNCAYGTGASIAPHTDTLADTVFNSQGIGIRLQIEWLPYTEGSNGYHIYTVDADAVHGAYGSPDYVARRVRITGSDFDVTMANPGCQ
jgi:MSHA biogenesis protein MshP